LLAHFLHPVLLAETAESISSSTEWMLMGVWPCWPLPWWFLLCPDSVKNLNGEPVGIGKWMADKFYVDKFMMRWLWNRSTCWQISSTG
jgi:hypothetical protein